MGVIEVAPAFGVVRPPNAVLRALAPLGALLFPTVSIQGNISLSDLSRIPEVAESHRADEYGHQRISFGTGHLVLQMTAAVMGTAAPAIPRPVLLIHGTADRITE